jgi:ABC-type antimicrobial peptide transport system permease subunit
LLPHGSQLTNCCFYCCCVASQVWGATRGLVGAALISLLALCLSGPPVLHLALLLLLLLLGTRSQSLLAVLLLVLGGVVASLYARGLRLVVRGADDGDLRFGLALIR